MPAGNVTGMSPAPASALHLVVQLVRHSDGKRRVSNISEITGMESGIITMQELYRFEQMGVGSDGAIQGELVPTGITPSRNSDPINACATERTVPSPPAAATVS